jgi:TonB family protein
LPRPPGWHRRRRWAAGVAQVANALWAMAAALLIQAPGAADPTVRPVYDAIFAPLKRSEAQYADLGPVGPYWPERAVREGKGGGAVLDCLVKENGRLAKCKAVGEKPTGWGFEEAALIMAQRGRISIAPDAPVGEVVHVRVVFDPKMKAQVEASPSRVRNPPCYR